MADPTSPPCLSDDDPTDDDLEGKLAQVRRRAEEARRRGVGPFKYDDEGNRLPPPPEVEEDRRWWAK